MTKHPLLCMDGVVSAHRMGSNLEMSTLPSWISLKWLSDTKMVTRAMSRTRVTSFQTSNRAANPLVKFPLTETRTGQGLCLRYSPSPFFFCKRKPARLPVKQKSFPSHLVWFFNTGFSLSRQRSFICFFLWNAPVILKVQLDTYILTPE